MSTIQPPEPAEPRELLLCSLREFQSIIEPVLVAAAPRQICEIGVEKGVFTSFLADFCRRHACHYVGIDPALPDTLAQAPQDPHVAFVKSTSLDALSRLPPQDVYFVDGDHNYFTVFNELKLIFSTPDGHPIVFLHDIGWPWGRRDQYCSPDAIPPDSRHPYSTSKGIIPGHAGLHDRGFRGEDSNYPYATASAEGGGRNGVLTAVEDTITALRLTDYRLVSVPAVFGLGILYHPGTCPAGVNDFLSEVSRALRFTGPLIGRMEENRINLFLAFLEGWQHSRDLQAEYNKLVHHATDLQAKYDTLAGHSQALQDRYDALARHSLDLQDKYDALARHSSSLQGHYETLAAHAATVQATSIDFEKRALKAEHDKGMLEQRFQRLKAPWRWFVRK